MAISERLAYVLTLDTRQAVKSFEDVGDAAADAFDDASSRSEKFGRKMQQVGAAAVAFAGVAGAGLFKLAQGAGEAQANMAALEQVVGEVSALQIAEWADSAATNVGLASKEAVAAATQFGGLGKIIELSGEELAGFSTEMVELAADMAAFKDVTPQQAIEDLQSAFAGSTEVLRKYNIFLDDATLKQAYMRETGEEVTGTLTSQQRIIATQSELYRQGADMLGQWNRESGELAGQQATLRAQLVDFGDAIGAGVLPHVTSLMEGLNTLVGRFGRLDDATGGAVGSLATLGVAVLAIGGGLSILAGKVVATTAKIKAFTAANRTASKAVGVLSAALVVYTLNQIGAADAAADFNEALQEMEGAADPRVIELFTSALADGLDAGKSFDEILLEIGRTSPALLERLLDLERQTGALTEATKESRVQIAATSNGFLGFGSKVEDLSDVTGRLEQAQVDLQDELKQTAITQKRSEEITAEATGAIEDQTDAAEKQRVAIEEGNHVIIDYADLIEEAKEKVNRQREAEERATQAMHDRQTATLELLNSNLAYRNAVDSAEDAVSDLAIALEEGDVSAEDYEDTMRDIEGTMLNAAAAAVRMAEDQAKANGETLTADQKTEIYLEELRRLRDTLAPSGTLRRVLNGYISDLLRIPAERTTTVSIVRRGGADPRSAHTPTHTGSSFMAGQTKDALPGQVFVSGGGPFTAPTAGRMMSQSEAARRGAAQPIEIHVHVGQVYGTPDQEWIRSLATEIDTMRRSVRA